MRWYSSYIDPAIGLGTNERRRLQKAAWSRWYKRPTNCAIYAGGLAVSITVFLFLPDFIKSLVGTDSWHITVASFIIYMAMLIGLYMVMRRFRYAPCVYAELRGHGYEVCTRCGYWLRDLDAGVTRCPECGREREPMC